MAWRRGRDVARCLCHARQGRPRCAGQVPGVALTMKRLAFFFFVLCFCCADQALANEKATAVVNAAIDGFIRPAYSGLARAAGTLDDTMDALCATPSSDNLEAARQAFKHAADAWSYAEIIRFGPVTE